MMKLFLQRFSEGAQAQAQADGQQAAEQTGDRQAAAALEQYRAKRASQGRPCMRPGDRQSHALSAQHNAAEGGETRRGQDWQQLIRGPYKAQFDQTVQGIVRERLKNAKQGEETLQRLQPVLSALAQRHGVAAGDVDGLLRSVLAEEKAEEPAPGAGAAAGETMPGGVSGREDGAQALANQPEQHVLRQQAAVAHYGQMQQQAQALRQVYQNVDLERELRDPRFFYLTSPMVGVDVRTAFEVVHNEELMPQAMGFAAQKAAEKIAGAVACGSRRPQENGMNPASQAVRTGRDPGAMSRDERSYLRELARHRGHTDF